MVLGTYHEYRKFLLRSPLLILIFLNPYTLQCSTRQRDSLFYHSSNRDEFCPLCDNAKSVNAFGRLNAPVSHAVPMMTSLDAIQGRDLLV